MDDLLKNCIDGIVAQQKVMSNGMQDSYKRGFNEGYAKGYDDCMKRTEEYIQNELDKQAKDFEAEHKGLRCA